MANLVITAKPSVDTLHLSDMEKPDSQTQPGQSEKMEEGREDCLGVNSMGAWWERSNPMFSIDQPPIR